MKKPERLKNLRVDLLIENELFYDFISYETDSQLMAELWSKIEGATEPLIKSIKDALLCL